MVIGKNLNKNSNWVLGNENIDEVNGLPKMYTVKIPMLSQYSY
jgi:hypothetical protein